nr:anti-sigma factor domain-containing protein [Alkaliphilus hydrothermalis]
MEIRDKTMVIMTNECCFEEIKKRNNVMVGTEIEFTTKDMLKGKPTYFKPLATVAAAIILMIISTLFILPNFIAEAKAVAMVTIDINPSVGLELNQKQEVLKLLHLNEDAEKLPIPSVKGKNVRVAIEEIMAIVKGKGYLQEDDNYVLLTTVSLEKQKGEEEDEELSILAEELKISIENNVYQKEGKNVVVLTLESNYETLVKAQAEKTSVGKMELYQRLEAEEDKEDSEDDDVKLDEIKSKNVKELVEVVEKRPHPVFDQRSDKKNGKSHPIFENHPNKSKEKEAIEDQEESKEDKKELKKDKKDKERKKYKHKKDKDRKEDKEHKEHKEDNEDRKRNEHKEEKEEKEDTKKDKKEPKEKFKEDKGEDKKKSEKKHPVLNQQSEKKHNKEQSTSRDDEIRNIGETRIKREGKKWHLDENSPDEVKKALMRNGIRRKILEVININ